MGQVPTSDGNRRIILIGSGRLARHFSHYLNLLNVEHTNWSRKDSTMPLVRAAHGFDVVFLLISDDAIAGFIEAHPFLKEKIIVHMSGVRSIPGTYGAHPLMTFGPELYELETYKKICFVTENGLPGLKMILPMLENPSYKVDPEKKALYHALCVSAGNFTSILVTEVFQKLEADLKIDRKAMYPYIEQTLANLEKNAESSLTGPLIRGDKKTVASNINALGNSPLSDLYKGFVDFYDRKTSEGSNEHT